MLITELKKLKLQSELVSIDRDCHNEELTGLICGIDENITTMHLYTCDGDYNGFTVFETSQITEVYWGNREHKAIAHLVKKNGIVQTPDFKSKTFQDLIIEINSNSNSVCFHSNNDEDLFSLGKILRSDKSWFKVQTFGLRKTLSPMIKLILRDDISRIVINSPYQNNIVLLHSTDI